MKRTLLFTAASAMMMSGTAALAQDSDTAIRRELGVGREDPDYLAEGSVAPTTEEAIDVLHTEDYGDETRVDMDAGTELGPKPGVQEAGYTTTTEARVITWEEMFNSRLEQAFHAIDANDDAMISRQEWGDWQADEGFYAERFGEFDRNGDSSVTWDEYSGAAMSLYDVSDLTDESRTG
ncbi:hypothetical protein [Hyphobacterium sp.]|jgi:hypothetical protein|uniref:hypothetical protein n=1 Tax=Hyphobacterium sp. TaxID=2004662 RepID=UPI003BAA254D